MFPPNSLFLKILIYFSNFVKIIPLATQPPSFIRSINVFDAKNISEIVRKEKLRRKSVTFFSVCNLIEHC